MAFIGELALEWVELGYEIKEPDDLTVEIWCKDRLVARVTPRITWQGAMSIIRHDWNMMVMGWVARDREK